MTPRIVLMANNIDEVGGAQRVMHVVAQGLVERGYPVDLVGVTPFEPRHEFLAEPGFRRFTLMDRAWPPPPPASDLRLARYLLPSIRRRQAVRSRLADAAARSLARILQDGPPGIIVTAQLWAMETVARTPHAEWPVIGQYHSSFEAAAGGRDLARSIELYRDVDLVTLLTPSDAAAFQRAGLNATRWLPNPLAFWPDRPVDPAAQGRDGVVTYLGRFSPEKGVRFLIEAWGSIAAAHPAWRLRLIGSGPEESALRQQAAAIDAPIEFLPPTADAQAALSDASIVVLPSLTEGLPLVMAEAMALGLPVVASDCSAGVRLLSDDGRTARIVSRGSAGALAGALGELVERGDERRRLGALARASIERYRVGPVLDMWETMFSEVLR
jgi:glycosyltransferase involved in cell wall biosynthesis